MGQLTLAFDSWQKQGKMLVFGTYPSYLTYEHRSSYLEGGGLSKHDYHDDFSIGLSHDRPVTDLVKGRDA